MSVNSQPRLVINPLKTWLFSGFLAFSLISTQWLGLNHHITHHESHGAHSAPSVEASVEHESCEGHDHSLFSFLDHEENSIECQLFDALTLAGLITGTLFAVQIAKLFHQGIFSITSQPIHSVTHQPYQSRAPPLLIL
jgi:hypothetical protein